MDDLQTIELTTENSARSIEAIERAEIDIQIATARRFPRPINTKVITEQITLHATVSEETAKECYYAIPRASIVIQGPSVRLSEIVAACYRNLHIAGRIIDHDMVHRSITAQAVAWDLESNVRRSAEWSEPITQKSSDAAKMTKLAAISKAERNAIFKVVPRTVWLPAMERCINMAVGDSASLATRISNAIKAFSAYGIVPQQVLATFQVESIDKLSREHLANLLGMYTALKEGTASVDDLFKPLTSKPEQAPVARADMVHSGAGVRTESTTLFSDEPARKPRGRPRKENYAVSQEQRSAESRETNTEPVGNNTTPSISVPTEAATGEDPKSRIILAIKAELEKSESTEARLLALMLQWHYTESPATSLQDIDRNTLDMVLKRWEQVEKYL